MQSSTTVAMSMKASDEAQTSFLGDPFSSLQPCARAGAAWPGVPGAVVVVGPAVVLTTPMVQGSLLSPSEGEALGH